MALPTNRGVARLRVAQESAPLPTRVQGANFGTRQAAAPGGTLASNARPPPPRPALTTTGPAQGRELFVSADGKLDGPAVARALNAIQTKIAASTAQARANPFANGQLFQDVPLAGTLAIGTTSQRPPSDGLPDGFLYYDLTIAKPVWYFGGIWIDATGSSAGSASAGTLATTAIEHGFGVPASGVFITNVKNAVIHTAPRIVLSGSEDSHIARIWFSYSPLDGGDSTADFYLYQ